MSDLITFAVKMLVSGVLTLLAVVLLWQAWRIWGSKTLVLTPFDFMDDGKPSPESGEQFARMVRADLVQLAALYSVGAVANPHAVARAAPSDSATPMELPAAFGTGFLETIELKAYGVELGGILKAVRRQLESPSEIAGNVVHQGDRYSIFLELTPPGHGGDAVLRWNIQYIRELPEATRAVACRIFRVLASDREAATADADLFRVVNDEDFCLFTRALETYEQYRLRKGVMMAEDAKKQLAEADAPLASLTRDVVTLPYVHKLAALVLYEQEKYAEAEGQLNLYFDSLAKRSRTDGSVSELLRRIKSKKEQTTPAVSRLRPLQPGTSVGTLEGEGTGMICCFAKDIAGHNYMLSAAPVLGSSVGAKIVQPAVRDGGTEADVVAHLHRATPTMAVAKLSDGMGLDPRILVLGPIRGFHSKPVDGQAVVTFGFDGRRREGQVVSSGSSLTIDAEAGKAKIEVKDVIITSDISSGGEIGAPVMSLDGKLVGMIFASGGATTVVLPVEPALKELGLELVK